MLKIGLTGGIASGKSKVAAMFAALGVPIVDTDAIAREVVEIGSPGLDAVRKLFGDGVLDANGRLDRPKLRGIVFADSKQRKRLEAVLHPLIRARTLERLAEIRAPYVIVVVPLLVETDFEAFVDRVLVVDCAETLQLERLMSRDGGTESEARALLAAQVDRRTRVAAADEVIDNDGPLDATEAQVEALDRKYRGLVRDCPEHSGRAE